MTELPLVRDAADGKHFVKDIVEPNLPFSELDRIGVFGPQTQGVGKFVWYIHNIVVA